MHLEVNVPEDIVIDIQNADDEYDVVFTHEQDGSFRLPAFRNTRGEWIVRFAAPKTGEFTHALVPAGSDTVIDR